MPQFHYQALDAQGRPSQGQLEADNAKAARAALRTQGLLPVAVQESSGSTNANNTVASSANPSSQTAWWRMELYQRPALSQAQLAVWTRQLAALLEAGLTVERALLSLGEEASTDAQRQLVAQVLAQVKAGSALSQALAQHPRVFDEVYRAVVTAGERSGHLPQVLSRLADEYEAAQALQAKLLGAALYPAIVSAIAILIVTFLMVYVLPQVAGAFASSRRSLPWLTSAMLALSAGLRSYWPLLLALLAASGIGLRLALRHPASRLHLHSAWLRWPLLGPLLARYNAARFANTLGLLVHAGLPILPALQAASHTVANAAMQQDLQEVQRLVREGAPLGLALAQKPRFPKLLGTFARLGAETGQAGPMLLRVGGQLAQQVQQRALQLAAVLEPLLILLMGAVVLLIVLAVLMPMIELNSFVR